MSTVARQKDRRWKARLRLPDGTRPSVYLPSHLSEAMAKEKADALEQRAKREGLTLLRRPEVTNGSLPARTGVESVRRYAIRWIEARTAAGVASVDDDQARLRLHVLPVIGDLAIASLGRADIERVVVALDGKVRGGDLAGKTAQNVWTVMRSMFADATRSKDPALRTRKDDPTRDVAPPDTTEERDRTYLYPSEFERLVNCERVPANWRRLYALAAFTLTRAGELRELRWDAVDLDRGIITVRVASDRRSPGQEKRTKSGKTRRVPIEPNLLPLLRALHKETDGKGKVVHVPVSKCAERLREHLTLAGLRRVELFEPRPDAPAPWAPITFHDLRGTGVTWAALRGDDPLVIQQRAGHADFAMTQRYLREAETLGRDAGTPFPPLPASLLMDHVPVQRRLSTRSESENRSGTRVSNPSEDGDLAPFSGVDGPETTPSRESSARNLDAGPWVWSISTPCSLAAWAAGEGWS